MKPPPLPPRLPCALALVAFMAAIPMAAHASNWEKIVSDGGRTVEIDTSIVFNADHGTKVSWGRIVLSDSEAKQAGYRTIKALNRYDCLGRSFTTVRRVYTDDHDNILREETLPEQRPSAIRGNSIDEQIWRKVCGPSAAPAPAPAPTAASNAANPIGRLADTAHQAARSALPPARLTQAALIQPIPMPSVPPPNSATAPPAARPAVAQASQPASSPPQRGSATPPLVLPAPAAAPPRSAPSRPAPEPAQPPALFQEGDWGYSGATGPEFWGRLRPEWQLCAQGKRQSPIDFTEGKLIAVDLDPVKFDYRPSGFVVIHSPRMLRVRITESMGMEVRGQRYVLEGFVLHRPAKTHTGNRMTDMEAHFFHRGSNGQIAVLAVQFVRGSEPNAPLQTLLNNLPLERGDSYAPQTALDVAALLPTSPAHYLYMGSLTTPPCTEGVLWVVMKEPMTLSDEQHGIFSRLHEGNTRPPQPAFERLILESR